MIDDRTRTAAPETPAPRGEAPCVVANPVRRIVEYVFWGSMSWLAWFWAAATVMWAVATFVVIRYTELEGSVWEFAGLGWTRWVLFAAGCVLAYSSFPMLVAQGLTRRRVAQASIVGMLVLAAVGMVVVTAVYALEGVVFDVRNVVRTLEDPHLFDTPGQLWWVAVESFLVYAAYAISGWLVGIGFYRFGTVVGLLMIVPGLVPVVVVEALLSRSALPEEWLSIDTSVGATILATVAVFAAGAWAGTALLRNTALKARPR